jgi:hypothetical protein
MLGKDKLAIPALGMLPSACGPDGFESLEGFGEVAEDEAEASEGESDDVIEGPFELLAAEFEDLDTIVLSFSHPLAAFDEVDPASFRISLGLATRYLAYYGGFYESTRYWDPNSIGYYYQVTQFRVIGLGAGPTDEQLRIDFDDPLDDYACSLIENFESSPVEPPNEREIGLFVHHRPGVIPLRDTQGNDLPAIGPDWVEWAYDFMYFQEFGFPNLDPKIEIPCP